MVGRGIVSTPALRDQVALLIRQGKQKGTLAEATADAVILMVTGEASSRCRARFGWPCFTCGLREGSRIHRGPEGKL